MLNIFENPILLSIIAGVVFISLVLFVETRSFWKVLVPIALIGMGLGIDYFIDTDSESISKLVDTTKQAFVARDIPKIEAALDENYKDSIHGSKQAAITHCKGILRQPLAEKIRILYQNIEINSAEATATIEIMLHVDRNSIYADMGAGVIPVKVECHFIKRSKKWKVKKAELLEINRQPVGWGQTREY